MTPSNGLLLRIIVAQVAVLLLIVGIMFGHALWLRWRTRRDTPRISDLRDALIALLTHPSDAVPVLDDQLKQTFRHLPAGGRITFFVGLAASLSGAQSAALTEFAAQLGLIADAERACCSRFWWRRLHGCRILTLVGGGEQVVPSLLHDRNSDVRTQAAEWAAGHPDPAIIDALIGQLTAPTDHYRFAVKDSLLRIGGPAIEPIAGFLAHNQGRAIEAALDVAIGLANPRFLLPACALCHDAEPGVRARAAALVGALGGDESTTLLISLLDDPADDVRAAAAEALGRVGHVRSAPALAPKLRDRSWNVRRAAGLALRELGAPGLLYLRRALRDSDPFAADMAHQLLDISALTGDTG